ncbi:MAG: entericidin A/B family lipoprotein [Enterobacteriaceae bacterium]|nr:entericidin A/B family lipoprotein [Enterobacteriaceae bacterium]
MLKAICAVLLSAVVISSLAGCNTVRGFGEDVQAVGGAIKRV